MLLFWAKKLIVSKKIFYMCCYAQDLDQNALGVVIKLKMNT